MSNALYDAYAPLIHSIKADLASGAREFRLFGGRGLGKTTVLARLAEMIVKDGKPIIINGRARDNSVDALRRVIQAEKAPVDASRKIASGEKTPSPLFIDDADYLLVDHAAQNELTTLLASIDWQDPKRRIVILTAENSPRLERLIDRNDTCSAYVAKMMERTLEPWLRDWEKTSEAAVRRAFTTAGAENGAPPIDDATVKAWAAAVSERTGGHPTLVATALSEIRGLVGQGVRDVPDNEASAAEYLMPSLESAAEKLVGKALKDYHARKPVDCGRLIAYASMVAQGDSAPQAPDAASPAPQPDRSERAVIPYSARQTGLVYNTPKEGLRLVGGLVTRMLAKPQPAIAVGTQDRIDVRPGQEPSQPGTIVAMRQGREVTVTLSGSLWRIFEAIHAAGGSTVTIETLMEYAKSKDALASAVQRIRSALGPLDLEGAVQSVRGTGYRWDPSALRAPGSPPSSGE
jgi:hypothetical protein